MNRSTHRRIAIVGAASAIGIRPYDDGRSARRLDLAPAVLRGLGLVGRIGAKDFGDVVPPPYRDFDRGPGSVRNEREIQHYSSLLADSVMSATAGGRRALVLGGDCSIVLGSLLAAGRRAGRVGLVYIDAHADFATPSESLTGSAASMCLALAIGRGDSPLARLAGSKPLVQAEDVALIGRRDEGQTDYGHAALAASGILDIPGAAVRARGVDGVIAATLERLARPAVDGFWIHLDADVLDPQVMPAVDSPEPEGMSLGDVVDLVAPLLRHPKALGIQVTIYDPGLDPGRTSGSRLVDLLATAFAGDAVGVGGV